MREKLKSAVDIFCDFIGNCSKRIKKTNISIKSFLIGALLAILIFYIIWLIGGSCINPGSLSDPTQASNTDTESLVDPSKANTIGNSSFNLQFTNRDGISFAYQDNWLYYSFENSDIRRLPDNGRQEDIEILANEEGTYLNVVGEWLYYLTENTDSYSTNNEYLIKRIKIDGSISEILADQIYVCTEPIYVGYGYIFYTNKSSSGDYEVYRMDIDGANKTKIAPGCLATVNFDEKALLAHDYYDSSLYNAYSFDGYSTEAYKIILEELDWLREDGDYVSVYDISLSSNYIVTISDSVSYMVNDVGASILAQGEIDDDCISYADGTFYYVGSPYDMVSEEMGSFGLHSIKNVNEDYLLVSDDDINCMRMPGDGWIYYRTISSPDGFDHDFVWLRCTPDGERTEYISWMNE